VLPPCKQYGTKSPFHELSKEELPEMKKTPLKTENRAPSDSWSASREGKLQIGGVLVLSRLCCPLCGHAAISKNTWAFD